jgi:hypothetical protein
MAAGGHFLSDIVWSGLIAFGVAHVLYYYVIRIPAREDSVAAVVPRFERSPRLKAAAVAAAVFLGAGILGGGILATPHYKDLTASVRLADYPVAPEAFEVIADTLDVELRLVAEPRAEIDSTGYVHGFGLPTNKIRAVWEFEERPIPTLRYRVSRKGWFTDIDGSALILLPARGLRTVVVRVGRGDIRVIDATGGRLEGGRLPALDLRTADGRVLRPRPNAL